MNNNALIVARTLTGVIAVDGQIPWTCPVDMAHFTDSTKQYDFMLMGRKTWQTLPGLLTGRGHLIVSNARQFSVAQDKDVPVHVLNSREAEKVLDSKKSVIVIGGAQVYERFYDYVDTIYETVIKDEMIPESLRENIDMRGTYWTKNFNDEFDMIDMNLDHKECRFNIWRRK